MNNQEHDEDLPESVVTRSTAFKIFNALALLFFVSWVALALTAVHYHTRYKKIRYAYNQALGAFVVSRVKLANQAELDSLRAAIEASEPSVYYEKDPTVYKVNGATETFKGQTPITDFRVVRKPDGTWQAVTEEIKK